MPTYNPKQLGEPEIIREINPTVLCAFLKPFEGYLRTRGLEVREPSRIENAAIEKLVDILINPTMKTPQRLLHAVFYVEEMSTPLAADSLLKLAIQAGMPFDEDGKHSLVGTAIGVLVTMIGALFTPLGLVVAAVAALGAYFIYSTGIAGQAIEYLKGVFETLKADTIKAFGAIANALAAGDITAAANVLWTYLKLQWIKGTTYLKGVWADFTNYLSDVWGDTAYAIGDVLISALAGLASVWNATLGFMAEDR